MTIDKIMPLGHLPNNSIDYHCRSIPAIVAILICLVLLLYGQIIHFDFLNYDDPTFTTQNHLVQKGLTWQGVQEIFSNPDYFCMQISFLSHMLDCQLYGLSAGKHHLSNLILHLLNTLLLFHLLNRMTGAIYKSAIIAVLFAIHPLNIESVAWIAERRNVLSTFFWFAALSAYWRYTQQRGLLNYLSVFFLFILGLMAKSMLVTFPFLLLLLDFWPLKRIQLNEREVINHSDRSKKLPYRLYFPLRVLGEKIPLMIISALACYLTLISAQNKGGVKGIGGLVSFEAIPFDIRMANAAIAYIKYILKILWPFQLSVYYPYPQSLFIWQVIVSVLLLLITMIVSLRYIRTAPFISVGWFWFMGTLVPVIGFVQLGGQAMADRYIYVPMIGILIIMVWGLEAIWTRSEVKLKIVAAFAIIACILLSIATWTQVRHWQNSLTLFEYTVRITPDYAVAHNNLGMALAENGRLDEALPHIHKSIRLHPNFAEAYNNLGNVLSAKGANDEAIARYLTALQINPNYAEAHNNLGIALYSQKQIDKAIWHLQQALRIAPDYQDARHNLNILLANKSKESP